MDPKRNPQINRGMVSRSFGASSSSQQGLFGSRPPPPNYSSLPTSFPSSSPPLLPLPTPEPAIGIPIKHREAPQQHQKKPRPAAKRDDRWKREPVSQKLIEKADGDGSSAVFDGSLYSASPPPSSLPLPRFSITKPKAVPSQSAASCIAEAIVAGASADDGATASDDLRRLLRL